MTTKSVSHCIVVSDPTIDKLLNKPTIRNSNRLFTAKWHHEIGTEMPPDAVAVGLVVAEVVAASRPCEAWDELCQTTETRLGCVEESLPTEQQSGERGRSGSPSIWSLREACRHPRFRRTKQG